MVDSSTNVAPRPAQAGWFLNVLSLFLTTATMFALAGAQWVQMGRSSAERTLTEMALPMGLVWYVISVLTVRSLLINWREPRCHGWLLFWLLFTLAGNRWISNEAVRWTEFRVVAQAGDLPSYDAVVLLGGGIGADLHDQPQLGSDGDRIRPVLQLWQAGRTQRILVTGTGLIAGRPGPGELTESLLISLGVPAEAIVKIEGQNTDLEMKSLKQWLTSESTPASVSAASQSQQPKLALVTSAFHLPRALRLAAAQGIECDPIPTAIRQRVDPLGWGRSVVPAASALNDLSTCWKEWLAALIGR